MEETLPSPASVSASHGNAEVDNLSEQISSDLNIDAAKDNLGRIDSATSVYRSLNRERKETRLLLVKAGNESEPLDCELQHFYLTSFPRPLYETVSISLLSHCWDKCGLCSNTSLCRSHTTGEILVLPPKYVWTE